MSLRVAGFAPAVAAVTFSPAPHSTTSCRTSVPSLVTSRFFVRCGAIDAFDLPVLHGHRLALALDVSRVRVARALRRPFDGLHQVAIFEHAFRLDLGETARVPAEASESSCSRTSCPNGIRWSGRKI